MKVKSLLLLLLFVLLLVGCQHKENPLDKVVFSRDTLSVKNSKDYTDCQNDLVYRDYDTGVQRDLTPNDLFETPLTTEDNTNGFMFLQEKQKNNSKIFSPIKIVLN